ncbi:AAA family ATPase [Micromonospora sp. NPDC049559]|uniref:MinD/ParA family ATP-binding protein n=1 Tax=Micromonospora sp. NPDC049559 TaxID=3155923 RepID=UPI003428A11B
MDGTETGWGRPAEPAPRWRALLDRARLGGRTTDQEDLEERRPGSGGEPPHRQPGGNGFPVRGGQPGEPGYGGESGYGGQPGPNGAEPEGGPPVQSRWAALETGYQPDPGRPPAPRYAAPGTPRYAWPTEPTPPAESRYVPPAPAAPVSPEQPQYPTRPADPRYAAPADPRYGAQQPAAPADPRYPGPPATPVAPADPRYPGPAADPRYPATPGTPDARYAAAAPPAAPPATAPAGAADARYAAAAVPPVAPAAGESRYAALDPGYRPEPAAYVPPPRNPLEGGRRGRGWRPNRPDPEIERAVNVLRRDLGTSRVVAFANPKGGVHKTTATVLGAATIGSVRGRGVLAWDDNELRGTLGLRAGSARHARTIKHLIADLDDIEARHGADLTGRLDDYLRHASDGSYDVLAGEESPRFAQRLDEQTVRRVLELLRRTHDVICVDTGNNVESVNWQTVLRAADQLVITTVPREDAAFTADWMLDLLHDIGMSELAENAVTLLSCPTPGRSPLLGDLEKHFATRTRAVAVVPYDPALETGSSIEYGLLQDETRQAWLRAVSMMVEPFAR